MRKDSRSALFLSAWARRLLGGVGLIGLLFAALLTVSCDSPATSAPLVRLTLTGLPAGTDKVTVTITANGKTESVDFTPNGSDPLGTLTIGFPEGTTGNVTFVVVAYQGTCQVGSNGLSGDNLALNSDDVRELPINIVAPILPCNAPAAKVIVQLTTTGTAMGMVTSLSPPGGISCGQDCDEIYTVSSDPMSPTTVTLHAEATSGSFFGWSGACGDVNDCTITLAAPGDYLAKASFGVRTCLGWCPDTTVPSGFTTNLYSIAGSGPGDIVAVGDNGKILHYNGTAWTEQASNVSTTLRGVNLVRGSSAAPVYVAVGDSGTALVSKAQVWTPIAAGTTNNLFAVDSVSSSLIYAVGASGTVVKGSTTGLGGFGNLDGDKPPGSVSGHPLNSISVQLNNNSSKEFLIVGDSAYTLRYSSAYIFDESTLSVTNQNLLGAWYSKTRQVAVGANSAIASRAYSNFAWQSWKLETPPATGVILRGVWGSAENNMIAVGDNGSIWQWDGGSWVKRTSPTSKKLYAVWGTGANNIYAVGESGTILHYLP